MRLGGLYDTEKLASGNPTLAAARPVAKPATAKEG
jgi:hypothetical protein